MANVMFKRGLAAQLPASTSAADGVFYLTTDTNRLYVGQGNKLVELNKSIEVVDVIKNPSSGQTALPTTGVSVGQFYYVKGTNNHTGSSEGNGNILCVVESINNGVPNWVQVNPDTDTNTNDNTKTTGFNISRKSMTDGTLTYEWTLDQKTSHLGSSDTNETQLKNTFTISASDIATLAGSAVDITSSAVTSNAVTVSTTGSGSAGNGFSVTGGNNITLTGSKDALTIAATDTQYTIASPAVSGATAATSSDINLDIKNGASQGGGHITINAGEDLAINNSTTNALTIYHKTSGVTAGQYGVSATTAPVAGSGVIKVPNITIDAQGHITAASNQEITLPEDKDSYITSVTAGNNGKFSVTHAGSRSNTVTSGEVLYYNIDKYAADGTKTTDKIDNQNNLGSFYTKDAIDDLLKGLNAVTYKGTVFGTGATVNALPTTGVKIGDAYLANADSGNYKQGDLIIATAKAGKTEGSDGTLAAADIDWTRIPSGKDADTTYTFAVDASNNKVTVTPSGSSAIDLVAFAAGDALDVSTSGKVVTFSHEAVTRTDTGTATTTPTTSLTHGGTFKAITNLTSTTAGHITGVRFTEFTLPADQYTTYTLGVTAGTPAIKLTAAGTDSGVKSTITFNSGTATEVVATSNTISYNHAEVSRSDSGTATASPTTTLSASGKFKAITDLTTNAQGHVTAARFTEFTLPADKDTTYSMSVTSGTPTINLVAGGSGSGNKGAIAFSSDNLTITAPAANSIKMNLEWGTF